MKTTIASMNWSQKNERASVVHLRAERMANNIRERNMRMAIRYLRKALPGFKITRDNVGYMVSCAHNWFLGKTGETAEFAHKAIAYANDWSASKWAESVARKAWRKYCQNG